MIAFAPPHIEQIRALCCEYGVTRLELFGSAAHNDLHEHSDIDLLVEFAPGTDLGPWMTRFFEFRDRLEAAWGRDVDLIMASGVRNPYLLRAINKDRTLLYAA